MMRLSQKNKNKLIIIWHVRNYTGPCHHTVATMQINSFSCLGQNLSSHIPYLIHEPTQTWNPTRTYQSTYGWLPIPPLTWTTAADFLTYIFAACVNFQRSPRMFPEYSLITSQIYLSSAHTPILPCFSQLQPQGPWLLFKHSRNRSVLHCSAFGSPVWKGPPLTSSVLLALLEFTKMGYLKCFKLEMHLSSRSVCIECSIPWV